MNRECFLDSEGEEDRSDLRLTLLPMEASLPSSGCKRHCLVHILNSFEITLGSEKILSRILHEIDCLPMLPLDLSDSISSSLPIMQNFSLSLLFANSTLLFCGCGCVHLCTQACSFIIISTVGLLEATRPPLLTICWVRWNWDLFHYLSSMHQFLPRRSQEKAKQLDSKERLLLSLHYLYSGRNRNFLIV